MKRMILVLLLIALLPGQALAAGLEVEAKSACLMDVATGTILFQQNADEALAPASVTKVMTMLLIMEAIDSGVIGWNDPVTASENAAAKGGSQVYLKAGEVMTVEDMLKSIAVSSANDCACAMAEHLAGSEAAFVERMNQRAQELGMRNTHFVNCTGLDDDPEAQNHRTTAADIAIMSRELLLNHPDIRRFTTIWMDTIRDGAFGLSNTNKLIRFYNGATGLKTGYTAGAMYCLSASAQRDGMELIAVVMGAPTSSDRFAACKTLLDHGFAAYALYTPELPQAQPVSVKLGMRSSVNAILSGSDPILVEKAALGGITTRVTLPDEVAAPVAAGQPLGELEILSGEQVLTRIPLIAEQEVEKLTWFQQFQRLIRRCAMVPT